METFGRYQGAGFRKSIIQRVAPFWRLRPALALVFACYCWASPAAQPRIVRPKPPQDGVDVRRFDEIPPIVDQAIADKELPGAVVLVGRGDRVVYERRLGGARSSRRPSR